MPVIRLARESDIPAVAAIYERVHDEEEAGRLTTGWLRGVYPTEATAQAALAAKDLYVLEDGGQIAASARINRVQMPEYAQVNWRTPARDEEVMVLHTLTVDPLLRGRGYGRAFIGFYEQTARKGGCTVLRIDTNARNIAARRMYARYGYVECGVIPTTFNGIAGVNLVCLEKRLESAL